MANQSLIGSDALEEVLKDLKAEMPTLASETSVRKIVSDYGNSD